MQFDDSLHILLTLAFSTASFSKTVKYLFGLSILVLFCCFRTKLDNLQNDLTKNEECLSMYKYSSSNCLSVVYSGFLAPFHSVGTEPSNIRAITEFWRGQLVQNLQLGRPLFVQEARRNMPQARIFIENIKFFKV